MKNVIVYLYTITFADKKIEKVNKAGMVWFSPNRKIRMTEDELNNFVKQHKT